MESSFVDQGRVETSAESPDAGAGGDLRDPLTRLARLFDPGSMTVAHPHEGSVRIVRGRVEGMAAMAYGTDARSSGGALGLADCRAVAAAIDSAVEARIPVLGVWHSGGARLGEGVAALEGVAGIFSAMVRASGRVPQISVVVGPAAGGAAYGAALTDLIVMAPSARLFVTGPDVVRSVTGENVDMESLGGAEVHARKSGVAHVVADDEADAYARARRLTGLLVSRERTAAGWAEDGRDPGELLPGDPRRAYDVRPLIRRLFDSEAIEELQPKWAGNVVVGLGRIAGRSTGVVANNPLRLGGCLDTRSAEKAARFVRMCDAFGIPLVVVVDVPGYLPGAKQEWSGVVRRGAKLLHAFAEASVPRVTVLTRKAFGGAYVAMNSRGLGATAVLAWPSARIDVMGSHAAVRVLHRRALAAAGPQERDELFTRLVAEYERHNGAVARSLEIGAVDEVIAPRDTRQRVVSLLRQAPPVSGAHGNIPL